MLTLLVVDDEPSVRYSVSRVFSGDGVRVLTAADAADGLRQLRASDPDVVLLDLQLPDRSGLDLFAEIHALDAKRPVIFITAHGTTDTAIEAMKRGAFDYLVKPVGRDQLRDIVGRAFEAARLMRVPAMLPVDEAADRIVGRSPAIQEMSKAIGRVAPQEVNILILGESGTGKELVARAIYSHSRRADEPFLAINCAALPENLLESELFGHEQGAFTGAQRRRVGKFEQCDGGSLFLDEIGDMAPAVQAKMLRVLQEQTFQRLGGTETVRTDVRVLVATNQDLERLVADGRFRADLYYRLKGVTIRVPALRERPGDVAELAHYFLFRFARDLGRDVRGFTAEAVELLERQPWPGNVRELQGVVRQAVLATSGNLVRAEDLSFGPPVARAETPIGAFQLEALVEDLLRRGEPDLYDTIRDAVDKMVLARVLKQTGGNQLQAAELLGINRKTLRHRLRALGLAPDRADDTQDHHDAPS